MDKTVKTRKEHKCEQCNQTILKGEYATFYSVKTPKFDSNDIQIGIEYFKGYLHLPELECESL